MLKTKPKKTGSVQRQNQYQVGFDAGYQEGFQTGQSRFSILFEGTSIIIPTYNKLDFLRQCIDSIRKYTEVPYEIIVVDNASTDGTRDYLKSSALEVRYHVDDHNRGFAGAVNIGLMMAKGKTIVVLNNDIIVTKNWLSNMLRCLHSDEHIGVVGPTTNYISGDQRIDVPYSTIADMHRFAEQYNTSDPRKWQRTDRLVGFCFLFRRSLLEQTGYMDEGYEVGNFEDDDWVVRVRLQNLALIIARDTFIHHFGSQSMKELGTQFHAVNERNQMFFTQKWSNPYDLIYQVKLMAEMYGSVPRKRSTKDFYPTHIVIKGIGPQLYWIENGEKHPFDSAGDQTPPITQLSQLELRYWPTGSAVSFDDVLSRWDHVGSQPSEASQDHRGAIVESSNGTLYQLEGHTRRRITNDYTARCWNLQSRPRTAWSDDQLNQCAEGLPIIAPPRIRDHHL